MSDKVEMEKITLGKKTMAIVCFGPATSVTGMQPAAYYQVLIDPNMKSPGGDYIRFDSQIHGNEIHGWQRVQALTICEVLEEFDPDPDGQTITMWTIYKE